MAMVISGIIYKILGSHKMNRSVSFVTTLWRHFILECERLGARRRALFGLGQPEYWEETPEPR
jgi:hypothetical protein